jgi:hypothetical protein
MVMDTYFMVFVVLGNLLLSFDSDAKDETWVY